MAERDAYQRLAEHLNYLGMGYPVTDDLIEILKENLAEAEAEIALAIPTDVIPLSPASVDAILKQVKIPRDRLVEVLHSLVQKGVLYVGKTIEGQDGYALLQVGFGFPQAHFWKGEDTPHARENGSDGG